jgi:hypothetical protein
MRFTSIFIFMLLVGVLPQCSSSKKSAEKTPPPPVQPPAPEWVTRRPVNSGYYIGIGAANKQFSGSEAMQAAKRNALQDMASEIEVTISSNSLLYTLESTNSGFKEDYKQTTKLKTQTQLKDFEQVDVYENDKEIFVFYRLSKQLYRENKDKEIKKAADYAAAAVNTARDSRLRGDYAAALTQYFGALARFETYLNEPITAEFEGRQIFFDNLIANEIKSVLGELDINPKPAEITLPAGSLGDGIIVGITLLNAKGKPVAGVPVFAENKDLVLDRKQGKTDEKGNFIVRIKQVKKRGTIELPFQIDLASMVPPENLITRALATNLAVSATIVMVRGESPRVYSVVNTRINGKEVSAEQLLSGLSEGFTTNGFQPETDRKKAHLILEISADTRESGEFNGFFTSAMSGDLVIKKAETGQELFRKDLSELKGVDLNYPRAGIKAYESLRSAFFTDYLPKFKRRYFAE